MDSIIAQHKTQCNKKRVFATLEEKTFIVKFSETNEKASLNDIAKAASAAFDRSITKCTVQRTLKQGFFSPSDRISFTNLIRRFCRNVLKPDYPEKR